MDNRYWLKIVMLAGAVVAYRWAVELCGNTAERAYLHRRLSEVVTPG